MFQTPLNVIPHFHSASSTPPLHFSIHTCAAQKVRKQASSGSEMPNQATTGPARLPPLTAISIW